MAPRAARPGAAGCGEDDRAAAADALSGDLQVSAAASLTKAFTEIGKAFEVEHPEVEVMFNFAASLALAQQVK